MNTVMPSKKLSSIHDKTPLIIAQVEEHELKSRLYEMGLYPGQMVEVVRRAPFGDPIVIQVDSQLLMLRLIEAELITIQEQTQH